MCWQLCIVAPAAAIGFRYDFISFLASSILFLVKTRSQQVARNAAATATATSTAAGC